MIAIVYSVKAIADAQAASVDSALGYPRAGVDIGGGVHVPSAQSQTLRYVDVVEKPDGKAWAYPLDAINAAKIPSSEVSKAVVLDSSWTKTLVK